MLRLFCQKLSQKIQDSFHQQSEKKDLQNTFNLTVLSNSLETQNLSKILKFSSIFANRFQSPRRAFAEFLRNTENYLMEFFDSAVV